MTVDDVAQILNKTPRNKWMEVMGAGGLNIPEPLLEEIQRRYSTDAQRNHACADYYVNYHPEAEWKRLTMDLYYKREYASARESKSFMSTGKTMPLHGIATDTLFYIPVLPTCSKLKATGMAVLIIISTI